MVVLDFEQKVFHFGPDPVDRSAAMGRRRSSENPVDHSAERGEPLPKLATFATRLR